MKGVREAGLRAGDGRRHSDVTGVAWKDPKRAERRARGRLASERPPADHDPADGLEVRAVIRGLTARQRQAVVLRYYGGLSVAETATAMGCREGTVRALTSQGLDGLRAQLGPGEHEEARDVR